MKKRYSFLLKNWSCFGLITVLIFYKTFNTYAQTVAPSKRWDKTIGGNYEDALFSLQQTSDGGFILGGTSKSSISFDKTQSVYGMEDYWIVKLDPSGNKLWDKTYGAAGYDHFKAIQQTTDGGFIIGGASNAGMNGVKSQPSKGDYDYWIVKTDSIGNKQWDKSFGGDLTDAFEFLYQTSDGGYILAGSSNSNISSDKTEAPKGINNTFDYWVVKIDALGNKQWDKTYGGTSHEILYSIQQTSDGGYILGGNTISSQSGDVSQPSNGGQDYWLVKLDSNGNKQWDKILGGNGDERPQVILQTQDEGYLFGGSSDSNISGNKSQNSKGARDFWILKLDKFGNKIWDKTIGGNNIDDLSCMQQDGNSGFILGGISLSHNTGDKSQPMIGSEDYWIVKVDTLGNKVWDLTLGADKYDILTSLKTTSDGGYILGGYSKSGLNGDKSQPSKGYDDYWIVKLGGNPVGIKESETNFNLSISPNPNQGKFTLQLNNLTAPKAEITVSDLLGRVVLQQQQTVSNKQLSEELTLPNAKGLYLLQVKAGEQLITRKIVVE